MTPVGQLSTVPGERERMEAPVLMPESIRPTRLDVLRRRYAHGLITLEEFEARKAWLAEYGTEDDEAFYAPDIHKSEGEDACP
jgi:hypothetical protein